MFASLVASGDGGRAASFWRCPTARFRRVAFARVSSVIRLPHLGKAYVLRVRFPYRSVLRTVGLALR